MVLVFGPEDLVPLFLDERIRFDLIALDGFRFDRVALAFDNLVRLGLSAITVIAVLTAPFVSDFFLVVFDCHARRAPAVFSRGEFNLGEL